MKPERTFRFCEWCNKELLAVSPPTDEQYENSMIEIEKGSILIPKATVAKVKKRLGYESHSTGLSGFYCGPACLIAKVNAVLRAEDPGT